MADEMADDASARTGLLPPPVPADLTRLLALVSVAVGTWWAGPVGFALFMLVLGGTMLPRALGSPPLLDVAFCASLLFAAWAAQLDWYVSVPWLDLVVHAVVTGLVATIAHRTMVLLRVLPERLPWLGTLLVVSSLGVFYAVLWEMGEWFGHSVVDDRIQVGYDDTMSDLTAGALGAVAAALVLARRPRGRRDD